MPNPWPVLLIQADMQPDTREGLVICPTCHSQNPDDNRFCGKCGATLPAPNVSGFAHKGSSGDLPPELVEFDKKIPLIAQPGSDRRNNVPDKIREQAHDLIQRDRAREAETVAFRLDAATPPSEQKTVVFKAPTPASEAKTVQLPASFLGMDTTKDAAAGKNTAAPPPKEPKKEAPKKSANTYLHLDYDPAPKPESGGVSGPSFLGLSGETEVEEEIVEEPSHTRRNLALIILLVLVGLGATQWKAIRDNALPFMKNGTEFVKLKLKGQQQQTAASNPPANAPANGSPNIEVAPTNQNLNQPAANGASTAAPANGAATNNGTATPAQDSTTAPATDASKAANATSTTPPAESTDDSTAQPTEDTTSAKSTKGKKAAATAAVPKKAAKPSAQGHPQINGDEEPQAGEAELNQANAASDPAVKADLLWKAVKAGNPEASVRLAEMYITGKGVAKNCDQAVVLLRSASAHSYARARGKLGAMYATGECVTQDRVQAYQWMSSALEANPSSSWTAQYRDSLWKQMTPAEQMRAKRGQ